MANFVKGARKAAAAKKGHRKTTHKKSAAGTRKAAYAKHGKTLKGTKPPKRRRKSNGRA